MSKEAELDLIAERGLRVVAGYLPPPHINRQAECERIFELERKLDGARSLRAWPAPKKTTYE